MTRCQLTIQSTFSMNKKPAKKAFTLLETIIAVGLIVFAAAALLEIFSTGIKNIDRLSKRAESKYLTVFVLNDDKVLASDSQSDLLSYISSKYPIDNQKVTDALNNIQYKKSEHETTVYMTDAGRQNVLRGFEDRLDISGGGVTIFRLKEDGL